MNFENDKQRLQCQKMLSEIGKNIIFNFRNDIVKSIWNNVYNDLIYGYWSESPYKGVKGINRVDNSLWLSIIKSNENRKNNVNGKTEIIGAVPEYIRTSYNFNKLLDFDDILKNKIISIIATNGEKPSDKLIKKYLKELSDAIKNMEKYEVNELPAWTKELKENDFFFINKDDNYEMYDSCTACTVCVVYKFVKLEKNKIIAKHVENNKVIELSQIGKGGKLK